MKGRKIGLFIFIMMLTSIVMVGCSEESGSSNEEGNPEGEGNNSGGSELRVALNAQPPTLDPVMSTTVATKDTARLIFETLFAPNSNFEPKPMLAKSVDISDDGKTYTIHLRQGVKFHNGDEMLAEDVVASMNRWLERSTITGSVFGDSKFEKKDKYTVVVKLEQPSPLVLNVMASAKQFAGIMPKEIVESATEKGVQKFIGTGPFKFVEWKQDQYIHFTKFEDYQPVDKPADGLAGKKLPLVDDIYFDIVSDPSTRLAGLKTGKYDIIFEVPHDNYEALKANPKTKVYTNSYGNLVLVYNKVKGLMSDVKMRKAVNAALNDKKILLGAVNNKDLFALKSGYMNPNSKTWGTDAGSKYYNQADPEKAKKLAEEAGYNGQEIRLMVTKDYQYMYNAGIVAQQQLKQAGFNVKLEVYDWPTFAKNESDPDASEMFITSASWVSTPLQLWQLSPTFGGGVKNETVSRLMDAIGTTSSSDKAKEKWIELQKYAWKKFMPVSNFGNFSNVFATTDKVKGFSTFSGPIFWNTKITK